MVLITLGEGAIAYCEREVAGLELAGLVDTGVKALYDIKVEDDDEAKEINGTITSADRSRGRLRRRPRGRHVREHRRARELRHFRLTGDLESSAAFVHREATREPSARRVRRAPSPARRASVPARASGPHSGA